MQQDLCLVLNQIEDPELGIGVVDLGLIYRAEWTATGIEVDFATTKLSCPYSETLRERIEIALHKHFADAASILVRRVFDPPWDFHRLGRNAHQRLGWISSAGIASPRAMKKKFDLGCWGACGPTKH